MTRAPRTTPSPARPTPSPARPTQGASGLPARIAAVTAIRAVVVHGKTTEAAFTDAFAETELEPRDRAFAVRLALTSLRRFGSLRRIVLSYLDKGVPRGSGPFEVILIAAAAQVCLLETPAHAAINAAVAHCRHHRKTQPYAGLANAVLRRLCDTGSERLAQCDPLDCDVPAWLVTRWTATYGAQTARVIARACLTEPALDLTVKADPSGWAERLGGQELATGSLRLAPSGRIADLPGFCEGAWWVQDAAAALPARLLNAQPGQRILDACAAPGGKTAQLAASEAHVTALDISNARLDRVRDNLSRLNLQADCVAADLTDYAPAKPFDAVLLDAPCSATGTLRRHPDILHNRGEDQIAQLVDLQARLLSAAAEHVGPGGRLVYCTCSLERDEGEGQITRFVNEHPEFVAEPLHLDAFPGLDARWITPEGYLRTRPDQTPLSAAQGRDGATRPEVAGAMSQCASNLDTLAQDASDLGPRNLGPRDLGTWDLAKRNLTGMDGFFAARLKRRNAV